MLEGRQADTGPDAEPGAQADRGEGVEALSRQELLEIIAAVKDAADRGTVQMRDYEAFVRCQEELARRDFFYM